MLEKIKPIVEDLFVEEIKGKLKEDKTIGFIDSEPSKDANNEPFHGSSINKLTTFIDMSSHMLFDQRAMSTIKTEIIQAVVKSLNEAQEKNFIFYRPIDTKLEYHYEKTYPSAKEPEEFFRFWIIFNVEKY